MKKNLFVIGSLQIGGAETVMVDILNNIYKDFDITVLLIEKRGELLKSISPNIKLKYLTKGDEFCKSSLEKFYNKVKRSLIYRYFGKSKLYVNYVYKKILKTKYDTEIAFLAGLPSNLVKMSPNNSQKIVWIHASVTKDDVTTYEKYSTICNSFDKIIGVSESCINIFEETFPESKGKIELIHNYVDINKIINKSNLENISFDSDKLNILSIGRIVSEKGFDRIINIAKKYENKINFYIIGDGPLKDKLTHSLVEQKINNVIFLGLKKNPYPYIKKCDAFLLSSRSEAYPTVVIEAMVLNKSIIATDVPGVSEILKEYLDKLIIPNLDNSIDEGLNIWLSRKNNNKNLTNNFKKINDDNLRKVKKLFE
ncbi:MAG TPA: glycosyltransferase [Candidatus Faecisoma merdavium]|nr:glycosyltransferase [Candidatus Faecisoma merdavium]